MLVNCTYAWNVLGYCLFIDDSSSSEPSLSLLWLFPIALKLFLLLLQPKAQHSVPNLPIFSVSKDHVRRQNVSRNKRKQVNFAPLFNWAHLELSCSIDQTCDRILNIYVASKIKEKYGLLTAYRGQFPALPTCDPLSRSPAE